MNTNMEKSPLAIYQEYLAKGELAYQWDEEAQKAVFYPRLVAPGTGNTELTWRVSKGLGTVYATTVMHPRDAAAYNVCLVDLDEGYRMMSCVRTDNPQAVRVGDRVRAAIHQPDGDEPMYPVFDMAE